MHINFDILINSFYLYYFYIIYEEFIIIYGVILFSHFLMMIIFGFESIFIGIIGGFGGVWIIFGRFRVSGLQVGGGGFLLFITGFLLILCLNVSMIVVSRSSDLSHPILLSITLSSYLSSITTHSYLCS